MREKLIMIGIAVGIASGIILINYGLYRFVAIFVGLLLAKLVIFTVYYLVTKKAIQFITFPGSYQGARRHFELDFAKKMASEMLNSLESFKGQINHFIMTMKFIEKRTHSHG
jgi:hypothetical protein